MRKKLDFKKLIFLILFANLSCDLGEIPIDAVNRGDVRIQQLEMGANYSQQIYFDLGSNSIIAQNHKEDWDIALNCESDKWGLTMNSSRAGSLAYISNNEFDSIISTNSLTWRYDNPSGSLDSTAAGNILDSNGFYIMDLGYSASGSKLGYRKFKIDTLNNKYQVRIANMDNSLDKIIVVEKDTSFNSKCISLRDAEFVFIEPLKSDWDLHFTQYMHIFLEDNTPTPYLVTGVLSNRNMLKVSKLDSISFNDVNIDDAFTANYSNNINSIGYDWKYYDFNNGYIVNPERIYILKDREQKFYKLHFVDFYNDNGEKGAPAFEFQEL
tara:strand:+ start:5233 stop:6207 length:975 start_codon:yes stop_codon:yes gene_type:complete